MTKLIVGNWKMNNNPKQAVALVKQLQEHVLPHRDVEVVLCPPVLDLVSVRDILDRHKFKLGAQNCHYLDDGAVTGEISATMLRGLVEYVIVGHSERRIQFKEDDNLIAKKLAAVVRNNLRPIVCVGEDLNQREHGLSTKVVTDQVTADLALLTAEDVRNLVIAYEPVWAIGTGQTATPAQIEPIVQAIRTTVEELYGEPGAAGLRIIYGAGVEPDFVGTILAIDGVDGLLPGGASLNYAKFTQIVSAAHTL